MKQVIMTKSISSAFFVGRILLFLLLTFSWSGMKAQPIAVFKSAEKLYISTETSWYSEFLLKATPEEFSRFEAKAGEMPETFTLEYKKKRKGYGCRLKFKHPADKAYVLKMLRFLETEVIFPEGNLAQPAEE
jgi:hypothetical protein